jgi:hypothetical protein
VPTMFLQHTRVSRRGPQPPHYSSSRTTRPSCTPTRSRPEFAQRGHRHAPHVAALHVVALHVVALHSYSSFSCCRTRACSGLAAPQHHPCTLVPRASLARATSCLHRPCQTTPRGARLHAPMPPAPLALTRPPASARPAPAHPTTPAAQRLHTPPALPVCRRCSRPSRAPAPAPAAPEPSRPAPRCMLAPPAPAAQAAAARAPRPLRRRMRTPHARARSAPCRSSSASAAGPEAERRKGGRKEALG